jgi:hypothetical protein
VLARNEYTRETMTPDEITAECSAAGIALPEGFAAWLARSGSVGGDSALLVATLVLPIWKSEYPDEGL